MIRVLEGQVHHTVLDPPAEHILTPENPGLILPEQRHFVTALWPMRMQVEFYNTAPGI